MTKNRNVADILDQHSEFTVSVDVGNSTVNVFANSTTIKLANSTVNTYVRVPTSVEYAGSYLLHANGTWTNVGTMSANNAAFLGGTAAASYQLNSTLAANVATMTANNATWHGTSIFANSTGAYPTSNTVGAVLGNTISRVVITGNSATFSSTLAATDTTITGFVNATVSVNSALLTTVGFKANATVVVPTSNSSGQTLGNTISRWVITANSVTVSGGASPDSNTLGTALGTTTQRWILIANTIETTGLANLSVLNIVGQTNTATLLSTGLANLNALNVTNQTNTATFFATTSANVGANVQLTTSQLLIGNSTVNAIITQSTLDLGGNSQVYSSTYKANTTTAGPDEVDSFALATYRGMGCFYSVRNVTAGANNYQVGSFALVHDGGDAHFNEYGTVWSNTAAGPIGYFTANANATHVRVYFDPVLTIDYQVKLAKTSIKV